MQPQDYIKPTQYNKSRDAHEQLKAHIIPFHFEQKYNTNLEQSLPLYVKCWHMNRFQYLWNKKQCDSAVDDVQILVNHASDRVIDAVRQYVTALNNKY